MQKLFSIDFEIVPEERAVVPVMDRSFLYGDSVYEVVRTYHGNKLFLLDRHFKRLLRSAERIGLQVPFTLEKLQEHLRACLDRVQNPETGVRIVVTRGTDIRFDLAPGDHLRAKTVILLDRLWGPPAKAYEEGISIAVVSVRRNLRAALDPNIKSGNYMNNVLALIEARKQGAQDAVMLNSQGFVTEGTASNVFAVWNGIIRTPKAEAGILEGISRGLLKDLMKREKVAFEECDITLEQFCKADEVFLTGTIKEVIPVVKVNDQSIGQDKPGSITQKIMKLWRDEVERLTRAS